MKNYRNLTCEWNGILHWWFDGLFLWGIHQKVQKVSDITGVCLSYDDSGSGSDCQIKSLIKWLIHSLQNLRRDKKLKEKSKTPGVFSFPFLKQHCVKAEQGCCKLVNIELLSLCGNGVYLLFSRKLWNQSSISFKISYCGVKGEGNPLACWLSSSRSINDFCLWYRFLLAASATKQAKK